MARGSAPGERRGGRQQGTPNKATLERLKKAELETIEAKREGRKMAKEVLEDFMNLFGGMAAFYQPTAPNAPKQNSFGDEDKFLTYAKLTIATASDLAQYQSPKLKAQAYVPFTPNPAGGFDKIEPPRIEGNVVAITKDPVELQAIYERRIAGVKID